MAFIVAPRVARVGGFARVGLVGFLGCLAGCGGGHGGGSTPVTYTISGTLTGLAPGEQVTFTNNGADSLLVASDGTFTFKVAMAQSGGYSVSVSAQPPGQTCTVTGATGIANTNVTVDVACVDLPQFAYVANEGDNTISQYRISSSGTLAPMGPPTVAAGQAPQSVTIDHVHHSLYATNLKDNTVSQYAIQPNGALTPLNPATVATGAGPWALAVEGNFAIVVNSTDMTLSVFMINTDGSLGTLALAPAATGTEPWNVTVTPNGKFAYVSEHTTASAAQYSINSATGAIVPLSPVSVPTGAYPAGIAVGATSAYAYVANVGATVGVNGTVTQYSIGADGKLTSLPQASVPAGSQPVYVAIDPSNKYAYAANYTFPDGMGTVSQYTVGANGTLTPMAPATVNVGTAAVSHPYWIAFDPFGRYAYVVDNANNNVTQYAIGAGGLLAPLSPQTAAAGVAPFAIATTY